MSVKLTYQECLAVARRAVFTYRINSDEREDWVAEAALHAWRKQPDECRENFRSFVNVAVRNRLGDLFRSSQHQRHRQSLSLEDEWANVGGTDRDAKCVEDRQQIRFWLNQLPRLKAQALVLYAEGVPHDEAAAQLGLTTGSYKSHLHRARAKVRQIACSEAAA